MLLEEDEGCSITITTFRHSGFVEEKMIAPHSVAEWSFISHFWTPNHRSVCKLPSLAVYTFRHLYIDMNVPQNVYENETIELQITVNADQTLDRQISVSFNVNVCDSFTYLACVVHPRIFSNFLC